MKTTLLTLILLLTTGVFGQYTQVYDTTYNSSSTQSNILDVKIDHQGNTYSLIKYSWSSTPATTVLCKRNSNNEIDWISKDSIGNAYSIAQVDNNGDVYLNGLSNDMRKFSSVDGSVIHNFSGQLFGYDLRYLLANTLSNSNVLLTGFAQQGGGGVIPTIGKFDNSGNPIWQVNYPVASIGLQQIMKVQIDETTQTIIGIGKSAQKSYVFSINLNTGALNWSQNLQELFSLLTPASIADFSIASDSIYLVYPIRYDVPGQSSDNYAVSFTALNYDGGNYTIHDTLRDLVNINSFPSITIENDKKFISVQRRGSQVTNSYLFAYSENNAQIDSIEMNIVLAKDLYSYRLDLESNSNTVFMYGYEKVNNTIWEKTLIEYDISSSGFTINTDLNPSFSDHKDNWEGFDVSEYGCYVLGGHSDPAFGFPNARLIKYCTAIASISEKTNTSNFSLYPNPTSQKVTIQLLGQTLASDITILTITGQLVKTMKKAFIKNSEVEIDISDLNSGIYLVKVDNATERLIIE